MTQQDDLNTRLTELYADYQQQLPERIRYIVQQFEMYCPPSSSLSALSNLHRALHQLAGSGATFGYTELGSIARRCEHLTGNLLKTPAAASSPQQQEIRSLLVQLSRAATFLDES